MTDEKHWPEDEDPADARSLDPASRIALGIGGVILGFIIVLTLHGLYAAAAFLGLGNLQTMGLPYSEFIGMASASPLFIGCTQFAYVLPLLIPCLIVRRLRMVAAGMLLAAGITFLLNSACWGFCFAILAGIGY